MFSCKTDKQGKDVENKIYKTIEQTKFLNSHEEAQRWLVENIERYFNEFDIKNTDFTQICTKQYAEFKTDALNIGMDGGMNSIEEFKNKWGRRYTEYAGINDNFLISGNDFGTIKVTQCEFINKTEMGGYVFKTVLEDLEYKSKFYREIVVVQSQETYLIDDVFELKNEYK